MSSKKTAANPVRTITTRKVIVNFDMERLKAPFALRAGAFLIDYIILILVPVGSMLLSRYLGDDGAKLINSEINNTGWLILVLLGLSNFVILPLFGGQTIGKMLTGLRVVMTNGTQATFTSLLLRHLVGYPLTVLTFGAGLLVAAFNSPGRTLHDYLAGTVVVYGSRSIEKKETPKRKIKKFKKKKDVSKDLVAESS